MTNLERAYKKQVAISAACPQQGQVRSLLMDFTVRAFGEQNYGELAKIGAVHAMIIHSAQSNESSNA